MELIENIKQLLQKPFPMEESSTGVFRTFLIVSVFVTFFLYIFEPFGIHLLKSDQFLICLGFGSMSFIAMSVYELIVNHMLKLKGEQEQFTFGKWIVYLIGIMLAISVVNFLFARLLLFGYIQWEYLPHMIRGTFAVGIFPVVVMGAIALMQQEKKYQIIADEINQKKDVNPGPGRTSEQSVFGIPVSRIRYVEALQNYVRIGHVDSKGQLLEKTERDTLKRILGEVEESSIIKCHRSYLVNRESIIATAGNAQGLLLTLADCEKTIPVSRSFVPVFRQP